jgi:phage/plasmid-like protein (TIGR03299 family)
MSHEFETGFFVGEPAWHGLGTVVPEDRWVGVEEGLQISGLDWLAEKQKMYLSDGREVPGKFAIVRNTDGAVLGTAGPDFTIVQNFQAFDWFSPFLDVGLCKLEAAGSLRGGARVWVLAKMTDVTAEIVPGDPISRYLLLAHAHDGSLAVRCGFTDVRVVCQNTLTAAVSSDTSKLLKIKHTKNVHSALDLVQSVIDVQRREFAATVAQMRTLASHGCDEATLRAYVRRIFQPAKAHEETAAKTLQNKILPLFESGIGSDIVGVRGTMWGAFNAVTEFLTHHRGRSAENRVDSGWFGPGADDTARALRVAVDMCSRTSGIVVA